MATLEDFLRMAAERAERLETERAERVVARINKVRKAPRTNDEPSTTND